MNSSEKMDAIAPAFVAAQERLKNPRTDSKAKVPTKSGGSYEYAYLSLPALLEHVRAVFKGVGLAFAQEVTEADGGLGVTTRIVHLSGQWLEFGPLVMPARGGPQDFGSATTYARRYALAAAVGLAADEDDDAQRVQSGSSPPPGTGTGDPGSRTAPGSPTTSTGGVEADLGKGPGSSGGDSLLHRPCGGHFKPDKEKAGWLVCSKCSVFKKAAA